MHLRPDDRLLVVAPHPDDETLGAGGLLARAKRLELPAKAVVLTAGDGWSKALGMLPEYAGREAGTEDLLAYGRLRLAELEKASKMLGLGAGDLACLGYPDGALLTMWEAAWDAPAASGATGRSAVPYGRAKRPGAPHAGRELMADLCGIIRDFRPTRVVFPHPADAHRDHRAAAAFVQLALQATDVNAERFGYVLHEPALVPDERMPLEHGPSPLPSRSELTLLPEEILRKRDAVEAHLSQLRRLGERMRRHVEPVERFVTLPAIAAGPERAPVLAGSGAVPDVDARVSEDGLELWIHAPAGARFVEIARSFAGLPQRRWTARFDASVPGEVPGARLEPGTPWLKVTLAPSAELAPGLVLNVEAGEGGSGWWSVVAQ